MRIYGPDTNVLQALKGSNIQLMVGVPDQALQRFASDPGSAKIWVRENILNYPDVNFRYIAVGNEISPFSSGTSKYTQYLLGAMKNVYDAISETGLLGIIH
ncbi:Glucan endo-1,3-beta-D-glucosidase [Heracleum sosnowskyi]|uniref:Glucan endo-1,3-beta-D-glucosidase n=1 Tax=Heracleum sosnowskyi TaxID=360622 RepID=A0AAD8M8J0_9APIA|nr:Glucan endo-1,3-beta-D-glucosidase [Heracleum sosnowskyi]